MKRFFDLSASSLGLLVLSPVFLAIALTIRFSSRGPILFRQRRVGLNGRIFNIYKFRSMVSDAEFRGGKLTVGGDDRITRVGAFLRRHKLDELPQLINVLKGDMSFVGPRPEVEEYVRLHKDAYAPLLTVRPGITHRVTLMFRNEEEMLAQANDPEIFYDRTIMPSKIRLYTENLHRRNLSDDIFIILATIFNWPIPGFDNFVLIDASAVETVQPAAMAATAGSASSHRMTNRSRSA